MDKPLQPETQPKPQEEMLKLSEVQAFIDKAVASALSSQKHQHTPIIMPELLGRNRADGVTTETKLGETQHFAEVRFSDGTVRRDYK